MLDCNFKALSILYTYPNYQVIHCTCIYSFYNQLMPKLNQVFNYFTHFIITKLKFFSHKFYPIHIFTRKQRRFKGTPLFSVFILSSQVGSINAVLDINAFMRLVSKLYRNKSNGFYVHAPSTEFDSTNAIVNYVTRYIGRVVMAKSRITDYDGTYVTY